MDRIELEKNFRQIYTMGEEIVIEKEKLSAYIYNGFHEYSLLPYVNEEVSKVFELKERDYDFYIRVIFNKNIEQDGYKLEIRSDKKIKLEVSNRRAVRYGIEAIKKVIENRNGKYYIPIIKIVDGPSFAIRGIVEGFYGEPWSHENRLDSIEFLKKYRMNTYMYAPKDDEYHRNKWRELYDEESLKKLMELKYKCDDYNLDFWYCISPGNDFEYTNEEDFKFLYKKLDQVIKNGINKFALLLDDIDYKLKGANKKKFHRPGIAHSYISNKVGEYLKENVIELNFTMCPTEYATNFNTEYIDDLNTYLNSDIKTIWTGYNCVAEVILDEEGSEARENFGHEFLIWENYPVNDFEKEKRRIYLGPLVNRGKKLGNYSCGMVSNPMVQWNLSKISLITISDYMWNSDLYNSEESYDRAIREVAGEKFTEALRLFCKVNRLSVLEYYKFSDLEEAINNKDFSFIYKFYFNVGEAIDILQKHPNTDMIKEMEPWISAFENQLKLLRAYMNNEIIDELAKICSEDNYILGIPSILSILNTYGITEYEDKESKRPNYWEF